MIEAISHYALIEDYRIYLKYGRNVKLLPVQIGFSVGTAIKNDVGYSEPIA